MGYEDKSGIGQKDQRKLVQEAIKRFKLVYEVEAEQRAEETENLSLQIPENGWTDEAKQARAGSRGGAGIPAVPERPMLSISLTAQPAQLIKNQFRSAHLGVNIHPVSEDAEEDTADVIKGHYYKIQSEASTEQARDWAFTRAMLAGRGYYRVLTDWDRQSPNKGDQKIVIKRILHQECVYFDPAATEADLSDARWCFIGGYVPIDDFREQYKDSKVAKLEDSAFREWMRDEPDWVNQDGEKNSVLVMEYYCKDFETKQVEIMPGLTRPDENWTLKWYLLVGNECLSEQECNGPDIPIVPVYWDELIPYDSKRRYAGIVGPNKSGQRFANLAATNIAETMGLEPRAPYQATPEQIQGFEAWYQQANIRNFPYLPYNAVTVGGTVLGPPTRTPHDQGAMSISLMAWDRAQHMVQTGTGVFDPALGNLSQKERSGRAIVALQNQAEASTNQGLQNFAKISLPCEARIVLGLMPNVYDRRGRVIHTLDFEGNERRVPLNAPYVMDGKRPRVIDDGALPNGYKEHNLKQGVYDVTVSVGKSHQTLDQEGAEEIGRILEADPSLMPLVGPTYFRLRSWKGAREISEILKKMRDKQFPGIDQDDDGMQNPEQLKAQLQAMQQENQQLKRMLQQTTQAIETDMTKQQAIKEKAGVDAQKAIKVAEINASARLEEQRMESALALILKRMEARDAMMLEMLKQQGQAQQAQMREGHEQGMARAQAGMTMMESERGRESESEEAERGREFDAEQAERDRTMAFEVPQEPEPTE